MKDITQALPKIIADHIAAHNAPSLDAFVETFSEDALLNDNRREFVGRDAIRAWAKKEIFGDNVRVELVRAYEHRGAYIIHMKYDGDFDKSNLPDPVILTNYFNIEKDKITQAVTLLNTVRYPEKPN